MLELLFVIILGTLIVFAIVGYVLDVKQHWPMYKAKWKSFNFRYSYEILYVELVLIVLLLGMLYARSQL